MRVAILADIHGNLPACEAVLEDIARVAPDYIVAAGDLALRGAHPRETVELLFDRCHALIMGNTDCYLAGNYLGGAYRERDHWKTELLQWSRDQLGEAWLKRLGSMPFSTRYSPRRGQDLFVCHANPRNLEDSLDPTLDENTVRRYFQNLDAAAVAFGHLHFPYRRRVGRLLIADVAHPRHPPGWRSAPRLRRLHLHAPGLARADPPGALSGAQGHPGAHRAPRARRSAPHPQAGRGALPPPQGVDGGRAPPLGAATARPGAAPSARLQPPPPAHADRNARGGPLGPALGRRRGGSAPAHRRGAASPVRGAGPRRLAEWMSRTCRTCATGPRKVRRRVRHRHAPHPHRR